MPDIRAVRVRDFVISKCKGKPSGPFYTGSPTVFFNDKPAVRLTDKCFPGIIIQGSRKVFINERPAGRVKDKVICGRTIQGSHNIYIE